MFSPDSSPCLKAGGFLGVLSVIIRLAHYLRHGNPSPDHFADTDPCGKRWRR